ncbi:expressed unknown protein [Seminavis robusta]|uniref:Uncharacterized protein n=1 Tax=Seminavis robusta TaxID=568900 RepID=A0A9N8F1S8_9STRA|nr:expressed unknown protein [Seminavis robusta]|eukprot:Sro2689_g334680.1 n/a (125) ;mRNA; f:12067-12441
MKPVSLILSLLLLGPLAEAFQSAHGVFSSRTLSHDQKRNEKHLTVLASTKNSTTETEENLSGLVNGMLKTHREMAKEVAELSALNKEDMPKPGTDGIYRMVNEKQFRCVPYTIKKGARWIKIGA